jgi:hypothetical protein
MRSSSPPPPTLAGVLFLGLFVCMLVDSAHECKITVRSTVKIVKPRFVIAEKQTYKQVCSVHKGLEIGGRVGHGAAAASWTACAFFIKWSGCNKWSGLGTRSLPCFISSIRDNPEHHSPYSKIKTQSFGSQGATFQT